MKTYSVRRGFSLIELLVVMAVIVILAGIAMAVFPGARTGAARSRIKAEIQGLSAALEMYKVDKGDYPRSTATDGFDARAATSANLCNHSGDVPEPAGSASLTLYRALSGDDDLAADRRVGTTEITTGGETRTIRRKVYFKFSPAMLYPKGAGSVEAVVDPFGNVYGYSTKNRADRRASPNNSASWGGFNPTFDLWSSADVEGNGTSVEAAWITNWSGE